MDDFNYLLSKLLKLNIINNNLLNLLKVVEYEGSNHIKNPEMQRVLLTHEVICR